MAVQQKNKHFYMLDYFLDGNFVKSEEMIAEKLPERGDWKVISSKTGENIQAQIADIEKISENEYKILMNSSH
jgi:hypothetical protein